MRLFITLLLTCFMSAAWGFSEREIKCMTDNVYHEARGESYRGQLAVMNVPLTRTRYSAYPTDVCKVIYQPYQFEWTRKRKPVRERELYEQIEQRTRNWSRLYKQGMLPDPSNGALNFTSKGVRIRGTRVTHTIGGHTFANPVKMRGSWRDKPSSKIQKVKYRGNDDPIGDLIKRKKI